MKTAKAQQKMSYAGTVGDQQPQLVKPLRDELRCALINLSIPKVEHFVFRLILLIVLIIELMKFLHFCLR
jgi:hypothetical protein